MKVLCTICARANSKGIKNKNFKKLNNKPLISHTIEIAKKIKFFSKIALSSDSNKIQQITKKYKLDYIISRSKKLSGDKIGKVKVIQDTLKKSENKFNIKFDYIVDLDVTSILRNKNDIISSFKKIRAENADNLVSVTEARKNPYFNMVEFDKNKKLILSKSLKKAVISRQTAPKVYELNASIYIWKRDALKNFKKLINNKTSIYLMPRKRSIDIDEKIDMEIVKLFLNG